MKLGLLTDIHEHLGHLRSALRNLQRERVDQIVVIGDIFEMGRDLNETCRLLAEANAIGVWGNHDYGLCVGTTEESRARYSPNALRFMASLRPRLNHGDCHFAHIEPWLDPEKLEDLWYFDGIPDDIGKLDRIFAAVPQRIMFAGHYHQWLLTRPDGIDDWQGERSVDLTEGRYFIVVGALCEGAYATFDTETCELKPFQL
jgi:predicted phosphodiesterase